MPSFNPRAREGRDGAWFAGIAYHVVSIHAPARGATRQGRWRHGHRIVSIHAPARGATLMAGVCGVHPRRFQSTRPRGARHGRGSLSRPPPSFNPRAREGRDGAWLAGIAYHVVSIHAPARGATLWQGFVESTPAEVSIHAPARGATVVSRNDGHPIHRFNPRAREGRDRADAIRRRFRRFQSTRPRGARPQAMQTIGGCACFNPRAREGRDVPAFFYADKH